MMRNPLDVTGFMFLTVHEKSYDNYQSTCNPLLEKISNKICSVLLVKVKLCSRTQRAQMTPVHLKTIYTILFSAFELSLRIPAAPTNCISIAKLMYSVTHD